MALAVERIGFEEPQQVRDDPSAVLVPEDRAAGQAAPLVVGADLLADADHEGPVRHRPRFMRTGSIGLWTGQYLAYEVLQRLVHE
jgi:hypothetical protein